MDRLANVEIPALLAEIRRHALTIAQSGWPELAALADRALPEPMEPFALLPICTGAACGGHSEALVPLAAGVAVTALALGILDSCADQDNPQALYLSTGMGRAINAAGALAMAALRSVLHLPLPGPSRANLADAFLNAYLQVSAGQDQDLRGPAASLSDYCTLVENKTVAAFAFAAEAGAVLAAAPPAVQARCRECGAHVGWMLQMLDDLEELWFPDSPPCPGKQWTFPLLYGLALDDPIAAELHTLASAEPFDRLHVCALLDRLEVRHTLVSHALDHRDRALAALAPPLRPAGRRLLQVWFDWLWRDGERLLAAAPLADP